MGKMRYIARCVVEAVSPVSIETGDDDPLYDTLLVRDVNGLPMLPASSIAGSLKARLSADEAKAWMGAAADDDPLRSLVDITDGLIHDSKNRPHDCRISLSEIAGDAVLSLVAQVAPIRRDRVRMNHRGVVDGDGKFERGAVPAGARFTFEMRSGDKAALDALVTLVRSGLVLGGASRSGHGQLCCIAWKVEALDLSAPEGWETYCAIAAKGIGWDSPITCVPGNEMPTQVAGWTLSGQIEGPFLIGAKGGTAAKPKRVPYKENQIIWTGARAEVKSVTVVPGSGPKGPLRHRTEFHLRALLSEDKVSEALVDVFGLAADDDTGRAGALRFHDFVLTDPIPLKDVTHVSLDRFSGGARERDGALFTDDMIWQPHLTIRIDRLREFGEEASMAFEQALADMAIGLCGIGAEWGEGAGVFSDAIVTASASKTGEAV